MIESLSQPFTFLNASFWAFMLVVLAGLAATEKRVRMRNAYLFLASLFFYWKTSGAFVAIKHIKGVFLRISRAKNVLRELSILRQCNHPSIIKLVDVLRPASRDIFDDVHLVFDYMELDMEKVCIIEVY